VTIPVAQPESGSQPEVDGADLLHPHVVLRRRGRGLIIALIIAPIIATSISVLLVPKRPDDILLVRPVESKSTIEVNANLRNFRPDVGVVTMTMNFTPTGDLSDVNRLTQNLELLALGATGTTSKTFVAGEPMSSLELTIPVTGSRITRYPLDRYRAQLALVIGDAEGRAVPITFSLSATLSDFQASATSEGSSRTTEGLIIDLAFARSGSQLLFALVLLLVFWALAGGAIVIVWVVVARHSSIPIWAWGFLAGVLFALPNLRISLPGSPPLGSLIDWAGYVWAVLVAVAALVVLLIVWFRRSTLGQDG